MVIYDNVSCKGTEFRGILYMNAFDADYLIKKYGVNGLKEAIPYDYIDLLDENVKMPQSVDQFSEYYYPLLNLGIQTDEDENLLKLIKSEVKQGNMFTRKKLISIPCATLPDRIAELEEKGISSLEDIYKKRSYQLSKWINQKMELVRKIEAEGYESGYFDYNEFSRTTHNLKAVGASSNIIDSDYFDVEDFKLPSTDTSKHI